LARSDVAVPRYLLSVADEDSMADSREIEVYGELGISEYGVVAPKVGVKIRLARKARFDRVLDSAAEYAELGRDELEDRLAESDDQVRDVLVKAAQRAVEVDDDDYLDALGRLVAGALDATAIDELAFVTSEISRLEPVHLRALLGFFYFGRDGAENADPVLSPTDAAWATDRIRTEDEIAYLLSMTREATSQVLLRLDRDGFIHLHGGPTKDDKTTSGPTHWAGRVLAVLFPSISVEFRNTIDWSGVSEDVPAATAASSGAPVAIAGDAPSPKDLRTISELETEIKELERRRHAPGGLSVFTGEEKWLTSLKRRLRRVDPNNPWVEE
jgi:CRP-like cAMP-binding protein